MQQTYSSTQTYSNVKFPVFQGSNDPPCLAKATKNNEFLMATSQYHFFCLCAKRIAQSFPIKACKPVAANRCLILIMFNQKVFRLSPFLQSFNTLLL